MTYLVALHVSRSELEPRRTVPKMKNPPLPVARGLRSLRLTFGRMVVLAGFFTSAGAHAEAVRPHAPLRASQEQLGSIAIGGIFFASGARDGMISSYDSVFSETIARKLIALGYRVEPDKEKATFLLSGTVVFSDCISGLGKTCGLEIDWEVSSQHGGGRIFRALIRHEEAHLGRVPGLAAQRAVVIEGNLDSLLSRASFSTALGAGTKVSPNETGEVVVLKRCSERALAMPRASEEVLAATALVKGSDGQGSAVIISPDGFLLTAAHVVRQGKLEVLLRDGRTYPIEVLRRDDAADVALVRLEGFRGAAPCLVLRGQSAAAGEDVYVLGSPGGEHLSFSISRGIVSGKREIDKKSYIQTDASINPGNSGGPLTDSDGQVLGIVSWKVAGERVEGLGFAVPVSTAQRVLGTRFGDESGTIVPRIDSASHADPANDPADPPFVLVGPSGQGRRRNWVMPTRIVGFSLLGLGATLTGAWLALGSDTQTLWTAEDELAVIRGVGFASLGIGAVATTLSFVIRPKLTLPSADVALGVGAGKFNIEAKF